MNEYRKQNPIDAINAIMAKLMAQTPQGKRSRRKHSYIYWLIPKGWEKTRYMFGYTPWKASHKGEEGFFAFKYRVLKNGDKKLVKFVRFGKRKVAKARSLKWYNNYYLS